MGPLPAQMWHYLDVALDARQLQRRPAIVVRHVGVAAVLDHLQAAGRMLQLVGCEAKSRDLDGGGSLAWVAEQSCACP